jgi:two-component system, NarL family, response regulator YdfI
VTHGLPPPTQVFVAADSAMTAARVEAMLRADPAVRVVETERDAAVVILAMSAQAAGRMLETFRGVPRPPAVIVLTAAPPDAWTARARRGGVRAVLRRDASAEEVLAAVAAAKAGLLVVHPDALGGPAGALPHGEPTTLTSREVEILEMMAEGISNRAIAARLKISRNTVKFHVAAVLTKLAARSRTEAVTVGVRQGLIAL